MSDFDPAERELLQNWRALQVELGLVPEEKSSLAPEAGTARPTPTQQTPDEESATTTVDRDHSEVTAPSGSEHELPGEYVVAESTERDVEVGEPPEEVPDEPGDEPPPPEKKRRRRRRRRKSESPSDKAPPADSGTPDASTASPSGESETIADSEPSDLETDEDDSDSDDIEEIEPISLPDWNVPTWQELIDSLYRPER